MAYISIDSLREIAGNINTKRDEMLNIYNSSIKSVLEQSKDAIVVSGLDFDEFIGKFNTAFNNLNNRLTALSDTIVNKVIPNYEDLSNSVKDSFNNDFASEMSSILSGLQ